MSDIADQAEQQEAMARHILLKAHRERNKESPDYDSEGKRICLECAETVDENRVKIVDAVRCMHCQRKKELDDKQWA